MKKLLLYFLSSVLCLSGLFGTAVSQSTDSLWFVDISHEAGLDSALGSRVLLVDVNGDNYPDLFWGTGNANRNHFELYLNIPNPDKSSKLKRIFKNITQESLVNVNRDAAKTGRVVDIASFGDFNNDGYIDLVTSIYYHRLEYYANGTDPGDRTEILLNDGKGHFILKKDAGVNTINVLNDLSPGLINATGISLIDYDYDGNLDIYIATWFSDRANGIGMPDVMLKGKGDGSFEMVKIPGMEQNYYPEYGVNATDWDNDGWQDILTSPYCNSRGNLFKNMKNGTFTDVAEAANYNAQDMTGDNGQALCQWSAQPADYNNDGNMDILQVLVHGGYDAGEGRTHISTNLGPDSGYKFKPDISQLKRSAPVSSTHLGDQGGQWIDIDGDGHKDAAVCQMAYPQANLEGQERFYLLKQNSQGVFDDISKDDKYIVKIKEAHSFQPADFDLDGDQDIFVSHQVRDSSYRDTIIGGKNTKVLVEKVYMKVLLLENKIGNLNNWSSVKVDAPKGANQSGIGSRIKFYSDTMTQMDEIQAGYGHFAGQQPFIRNIGIGKQHRIDSITVRFPKKDLQSVTVKTVPLNTILEIDENGLKNIIKPWEGLKPVICFVPPLVDFGKVNSGSTKDMTFDIINMGDTLLNVTDIRPEALDIPFVIVSPTFPLSIAPGQSKKVTIRFTASGRGSGFSSFMVKSNSINNPDGFVDVSAYSFQKEPILEASAKWLDFGKVFTDTSTKKTVILKNSGELPLTIQDIFFQNSTTSKFSIEPFNKNTVLDPGNQMTITIDFTPTEAQVFTNTLEVHSNSYNEAVFFINMMGTGQNKIANMMIVNPILFFGKVDIGKQSYKTLQLKNSGNGKLTINNIIFEMPLQDIFNFADFNFPYIIMPGETKEIEVSFTPKIGQLYKTKVYFNSNSADSAYKYINLSGTGNDGTAVGENLISGQNPILSVYPNPVDGRAFINLNLDNINSKLNISLSNELGITIKNIYTGYISGQSQKLEFTTEGLAKGLYFIILRTDTQTITCPVIIN